jgi:hypothetical protein
MPHPHMHPWKAPDSVRASRVHWPYQKAQDRPRPTLNSIAEARLQARSSIGSAGSAAKISGRPKRVSTTQMK